MGLTISAIELKRINEPLKQAFKTSLQTVTERESLIIKVVSDEGLEGFGECIAFSTPWYTEETVTSCRFVIEHVLVPLLLDKTLENPSQVDEVFKAVKGNRMAKAAVETAVWDLFAKNVGCRSGKCSAVRMHRCRQGSLLQRMKRKSAMG
ncbi:hypothetical protein [Planococcus koreensis]|uniref:hypothetical protein n=1 Tax=Planococcus koreensis TaxID=112331 RepID=UPI001F4F92E5|nr:hypothetical protein [Planococcus koreensis]